jgi:hypothetical protein
MKTLNESLNHSWDNNEWIESWSAYILKTIPWKTVGKDLKVNDQVFITLRPINENIKWKTRVFTRPSYVV